MMHFYRSSDEKVIAGVCAGIARRFDLNVTGLRWFVVFLTLFLTGVPSVVYIALWAVLKPRRTSDIIGV